MRTARTAPTIQITRADRTSRLGPPGRDRESGSVTLFFVVAALALFAMIGLVVDGGTKIRAAQQADALAAEAARAGGQAITVPAAVRGDTALAQPAQAVQAAQSYLRDNALSGSVRVTDGGRRIVVHVSVARPTVFLGLIGVTSMTVEGNAQARLVRGVTGEEPT
jgi:Flp pilus assembly protein TadG